MRVKGKQSGFTLIELLVVISIIGLLSSIVLAAVSDAREKAENAHILSMIREYRNALELYYNDNDGSYPDTGGTWYCLGEYSSACYPGITDNIDLDSYISGNPPVNDSAISVWTFSFIGARYLSSGNSYTINYALNGDVNCGFGASRNLTTEPNSYCSLSSN